MDYKKMALIPIVILIVSATYLILLVSSNQLTFDIDFKGGTQLFVTSDKQLSDTALESVLKQYDASVRTSRGITGYAAYIDFDASINSQDVLKTLNQNGYTFSQYSVQTTGPEIGANFFQQALMVLIISFIFMAVTVFIMFKNPLPSAFLILTVVADLTETFVITQIIGMKLSLGVFAALLLLIGAAVGDNVMFTTRLLKSDKKDYDMVIRKTFKTGMTMFAAVQVAFVSLLLISTSAVITQVAAISIIGGVLDLMNSWSMNLGLLMMFLARKIK